MIRGFGGKNPVIAEETYIAENALIVGDVKIGDHSSIWPNAVLRGDEGRITVGRYTNIQDNVVVHSDLNGFVEIGDYVTVGHGAIIHGCKIKNNVIVGMGAVVLNNAVIGENCIIGAGAVVLENAVIQDNSLVVGVPGVVKAALSKDKAAAIKDNALSYWRLAEEYLHLK
ncbi:MAG: gamma carbonic anhydrase family protein [Candidatus Odinarchaeum yellowstonii]|jgi:carbonic anhydrase/acetyltransferase-like protein (isoleucine patch superfamily)|uniref:Gamma carbonic anhydrase family protein n=1 Tax=Odinarchaeota yellowstonii (strain LCB_4) TaxID=1841599 RepID=A0AAF0D2R2_ODILC|nr:MAG: gamma carbonic anhydrase family protein [Candidatus Odinarchaeum yellowstonii]